MPAAKKARKPAKKTTKVPHKLSPSHKKALAEGRTMSATVDRYLHVVNTPKRRGRKISQAALLQRLVTAQDTAKHGSGVEKLLAAQEARDLTARLENLTKNNGSGAKEAEQAFIRIAKTFGENRGIGYGAWRDAGVPAVVLKKAGVRRTRGPGTRMSA